jgi:hypothetical protein
MRTAFMFSTANLFKDLTYAILTTVDNNGLARDKRSVVARQEQDCARHLRPSFRQGQRDRSPDTLGRAGYQCHSPFVRSY